MPHPIRSLAEQAMSDVARESRQGYRLLELQAAERHLANKSARAIAAMYGEATDAESLTWLVEDQAARGWPDIPRPSVVDLEGEATLTKAIAARQKARLEKDHKGLLAAQAKLAKVARSATLHAMFDHARRGRGWAMLPKGRVVPLGRSR